MQTQGEEAYMRWEHSKPKARWWGILAVALVLVGPAGLAQEARFTTLTVDELVGIRLSLSAALAGITLTIWLQVGNNRLLSVTGVNPPVPASSPCERGLTYRRRARIVAGGGGAMKKFRSYEPSQGYLLPPAPKEWLPDGHLAHFVDQVAEQFDLKSIYSQYSEERGQPQYRPRMMVKVWLYGYCLGIRSSRRLERPLREDVGFRMLSGNQQADHWTLSEFRRRHLEALGDLFIQTVQLAVRAGLVKLGQVAIDGTKIKAYASKHAAMSYGRMRKEEERLRNQEVENQDREEDELYGEARGDELPEHLRTAEKRREAIERAMRELPGGSEAAGRGRASQAERAGRSGRADLPPPQGSPDGPAMCQGAAQLHRS